MSNSRKVLVVRMAISNSRRFFIIDCHRKNEVEKWKWCLIHREKKSSGYLIRTAVPHVTLSHFLFGRPPKGFEWDHKNRNKLDYRKSNMRLVTRSQNQWNRTKQRNNKSGYKGVWRNGRKWLTQIWVFGKRIHLGYFDTARKAYEVYSRAARKYHGGYSPVVSGDLRCG